MQYLLLIYEQESLRAQRSTEENNKIFQSYKQFTGEIVKSGHLRAGDALQSVATATTVQVRGGKTLTTDGPFAETREQLGGYYLVEAKDLDEAIGIAARIPGAQYGSIEIRPIMLLPKG